MPPPEMTQSRASTPRMPLLAQPFEAGLTGWLVVMGAIIAELAGSAVTNRMSTAVVAPVLAVPVAVALGFAVAQWWQVRSCRAEPASWWHLGGAAAAVVTWAIWPTQPGVLDGAGNASAACSNMGAALTPGCLQHAARALDNHNVAWWSTLALILIMATLVRRSRIAAWATIPVAFAGCAFATHFMEQLLLYYHAGG